MTTVLCGVHQALDILASDFPEVEVIDLTTNNDPLPKGAILFAGYGEETMKAADTAEVSWIQLPHTGIDTVNPSLLNAPVVTCAKGAESVPIAEYVLASMLAFGRTFPEAWLKEAPEHWFFQKTQCLMGQRVGLVGFGGIGQRVATLAKAFDMDVVAVRRTTTPSEIPGVSIATSLEEILPTLDHLVLCAPSTTQTKHLMNEKMFSLVKPGLHLVNIARGALIDEEALRVALDDGRVARASLDVFDPEPLPAGHWLYSHEKAFVTPHSSWTGRPFLSGATQVFCENLRRHLDGLPLEGIIDVELGY